MTESFKYTKYLLIPIVKSPYSRIGPEKWQDWYRQLERTVAIAQELKKQGGEITITILSNFQPQGKPSEIEIYIQALYKLAPELYVNSYKETNSTFEQVEKSFKLKNEISAELIFISAWMQYPRVLFLAHGRAAQHFGVFGIPRPAFALIDSLCIILEPLVTILGLNKFFNKIIVRQREKGKIL